MVWTVVTQLLKETYANWDAHEAPRLGASLAFYSILSLSPLLILTVAIVGLVFGQSSAQSQILDQVQEMVGSEGGHAAQEILEKSAKPSSGILASVIGLVTLLFGASGVCGELRSALNTIWKVKPSASPGLFGFVKQRFFSFGMVLAIGFLLMTSLALSAGLAAASKFAGSLLPLSPLILAGFNFIVSLAGIAALFALIFRYVPTTRAPWKSVLVGGTFTAFFFTVGKMVIGLYLGKASVGSAYGAAGSLIVMIVWIYYSSQIFFFGAEFTHVLVERQPV